ncbi:hypothetical protein ACQWTT_001306 [Acinetobacter baumannii]
MGKTNVILSDVARVYVNNVEVGSIPLPDYLQMMHVAKRDYKIYIAQALNCLYTFYFIFNKIVLSIPTIWFILALFFAVFDSNLITEFFTLIQTNTPVENKELLIYILKSSLILSFCVFLINFPIVGGDLTKFGFQNKFKLSVANKLMQILEVPALGEIRITNEKNR